MLSDEHYLRLCVELAARGRGRVSPNPLVGCVIVKNGEIIGQGWHKQFGKQHAEIEALKNTRDNVEGADLFVNLEPCSHFGKTPPCVNAIIEKKIRRVIIGTRDPNPLVAGKGINKLKKAGIAVTTGALQKECAELNKFFFKHIRTNTPYVTVKIAQTVDGKIAAPNAADRWITSEPSRKEVHRMRSEYDAVLIGIGTLLNDNPRLTVRSVKGRQPLRVVLDSRLRVPLQCRLLRENPDKNVIIITSKHLKANRSKLKSLNEKGANVLFVNENASGRLSLPGALRQLGEAGVSSVLVEGGSEVFTSFLRDDLADELRVFIAPKVFGDGIPAFHEPALIRNKKARIWQIHSAARFGDDILIDLRKIQT